jgi:hypothetical protein
MLEEVAVGVPSPISTKAGCPSVATRIWNVSDPKAAVACDEPLMVKVVFVPAREAGRLLKTAIGFPVQARSNTAYICPPMFDPDAPDGVNETTSSSTTSRAAVGVALKCCPAAAPDTVTVMEPPVIAVPLMAVAIVASAVVIVPCVTQPSLRMRPRNGARI